MRKLTANIQSSSEGFKWLRNTTVFDGKVLQYFSEGKFNLVMLASIRNILRVIPDINGQNLILRMLSDDLQVMAVGAESVVVRSGDKVKKYLTGKTENPESLLRKIEQRHGASQCYIGQFMPETRVYLERAQIFKGQRAETYVCIEQDYISVLEHDPHRRGEGLSPEIKMQLADFSQGLAAQFNETGLLMDVTNAGNIVWGSIGAKENQLYLVDTLSVAFPEVDFIGKKVPFWDPQIHLESLAELLHIGMPINNQFPSLSRLEVEALLITK